MPTRLMDEAGGGFDARGAARVDGHSDTRASLGARLVAAARAAAAAHLAETARQSLRSAVEPPRYRAPLKEAGALESAEATP